MNDCRNCFYAKAFTLYETGDDYVKVVHGRWIVENEESIRCSECCFNRATIKMPMDYCPNCGAKMDAENYVEVDLESYV